MRMRLILNGLQIRPLSENDYRPVYRLYRQLTGAGPCYAEGDFARIFNSFFLSEDREAFVATVHNNVIGFVTLYYLEVLHHHGLVASIQELVVTEEFRGRGVGRALVEFVRGKVQEKRCHGLEIATDLWQSGAKKFYERCGLRGKTQMVAT
ncbi:ribosomal protein S18 acetylase RimI-like enzyme [Hydrogenispora ethanolica]|uniref:Ribosomal protein S18 acetylase RimI-like enzyme n=2 Tax=Hydrogenispora ethanolica TaxID=1082276 RepID=A0A4V2QEZ8_HYDET|nr:ribosomal protein S18 acetylase RimI-like enzyme [Hydrogenispora ethanolica]